MPKRISSILIFYLLCLVDLSVISSNSIVFAEEISPECQNVDFASAQSIFECVGTIRHRNGTNKFNNIGRNGCFSFVIKFLGEIGKKSAIRDTTQVIPSCKIVSEVAKKMTGEPTFWDDCVDYPTPDPETHMRTCMKTFAPAFYGTNRLSGQLGTCKGYKSVYERALRFVNNRHSQKLPQGYVSPTCETINDAIAELNNLTPQYQKCSNYNPQDVRQHLLDCVASTPKDFRYLHDCISVRMAYEERLKATHDGLPREYKILSCDDAQVVLDKIDDYRKEIEAQKIAKKEAERKARIEKMAKEEKRKEEIRARILAERKTRKALLSPCSPDINHFPEQEYGRTLTALNTPCASNFTQKEQLFVAGIAEGLVNKCGLPKNSTDRMEVAKFVSSSMQVAIGGSEYSNPNLGKMMRDQAESQAAYLAGTIAFNNLGGCNDLQAEKMANNIALSLKNSTTVSIWVDSCELYYAGVYSRNQCQCMSDNIRAINPQIHSQEFTPGSIKGLIEANPLLAFQMGVQCGIGDY